MGRKDDDNEMGDEQVALDLLSPEERAAFEDEDEAKAVTKIAAEADDDADDDQDDAKAKASDADDQDDDSDEEDGDDDDADADDDGKGQAEEKGEADKADPDTAKESAADADAAAAEAAKLAEAAAEPAPALDLSPLQAAHEARLKEIAAEKAAAFKKYNDGDITPEEYAAADEKAANARDAARDDLNANIAWFKEAHAFKGEVRKEVNYDKDQEKEASLNDWLKILASKPENGDKPGRWFLDEAHKKVKLEFGVAEQAKAEPSKAEAAKKPEPKPQKKAPDLTKIPKTVGGLPAAAEESADGDSGEFAHLDGLSGMALERALAKMSPEQEERYLRG